MERSPTHTSLANDELGEAILNRDLTTISRIGSIVAAIVRRGAS